MMRQNAEQHPLIMGQNAGPSILSFYAEGDIHPARVDKVRALPDVLLETLAIFTIVKRLPWGHGSLGVPPSLSLAVYEGGWGVCVWVGGACNLARNLLKMALMLAYSSPFEQWFWHNAFLCVARHKTVVLF